MTLDKLIFDVREAINDYTINSSISNRYIEYLYQIKRAKYLRQDLNNLNRSIDNSLVQSLCIGLEETSVMSCDTELPGYCKSLLKTKNSIPKFLELHTKPAIVSVKPIDRLSVPFNFTTVDRVPYLDGSTFKSGIYAFLEPDNNIYLVSKDNEFKNLECITIKGVFEDPIELAKFTNCCNCNPDTSKCFDRSKTDYPLQPHFIDLIRNEIVYELSTKIQFPEDKINDSDSLDINNLNANSNRNK